MKKRKRPGIVGATLVASLALAALGASAPASASNVKTYWDVKWSGTIYCPSTMVARVSFKSPTTGKSAWGYAPNQSFRYWSQTTATHYVYSPSSGTARVELRPFDRTVYNVSTTCV